MFLLLPSLEDAGVWIRKRLLQTLSSAKCSALLAVGDSCRTLLPENNAKGTSDQVCPAPSGVLGRLDQKFQKHVADSWLTAWGIRQSCRSFSSVRNVCQPKIDCLTHTNEKSDDCSEQLNCFQMVLSHRKDQRFKLLEGIIRHFLAHQSTYVKLRNRGG